MGGLLPMILSLLISNAVAQSCTTCGPQASSGTGTATTSSNTVAKIDIVFEPTRMSGGTPSISVNSASAGDPYSSSSSSSSSSSCASGTCVYANPTTATPTTAANIPTLCSGTSCSSQSYVNSPVIKVIKASSNPVNSYSNPRIIKIIKAQSPISTNCGNNCGYQQQRQPIIIRRPAYNYYAPNIIRRPVYSGYTQNSGCGYSGYSGCNTNSYTNTNTNTNALAVPDPVRLANGRVIRPGVSPPSSYTDGNPVFQQSGTNYGNNNNYNYPRVIRVVGRR